MLKKLIIVVAIFTGLVSCKSKSAFNYSEKIVAIEKTLTPDIQETENKVRGYLAADQYDSVAVAGEKMEKEVQEKIDQIDALKVPAAKGSADFKAASLRYFRFIKSLYTGYKNLGNAKTEEDRSAVITDLQGLVAEKNTVLSDMQKEQKKYAEANGFRVQ